MKVVDLGRVPFTEGTGTFCRPLDTNCAAPISTASFVDGSDVLSIKAPEGYADFVFTSPGAVTTYTSGGDRLGFGIPSQRKVE